MGRNLRGAASAFKDKLGMEELAGGGGARSLCRRSRVQARWRRAHRMRGQAAPEGMEGCAGAEGRSDSCAEGHCAGGRRWAGVLVVVGGGTGSRPRMGGGSGA